jgi:hypothetical protein
LIKGVGMKRFLGTRVCTTLLLLCVLHGPFARRSNAACVGDCDSSGDVTVNELITMVNITLGSAPLSNCEAGDADASGDITINEIIAAVNSVLGGCPLPSATLTPSPSAPPTPTFSLDSTFPQIQSAIFNPTCLGVGCHNATDQSGNLVLEGSGAYANLVGVVPFNVPASQAGLLRVDPGKPANSFLLTKLTLPTVFDLQFGSRMPLAAQPLTAQQIENVSAWILRGALPDEAPAGN